MNHETESKLLINIKKSKLKNFIIIGKIKFVRPTETGALIW